MPRLIVGDDIAMSIVDRGGAFAAWRGPTAGSFARGIRQLQDRRDESAH